MISKIPQIKKNAWISLTVILILTTVYTVVRLLPYENNQKTSVEQLGFTGSYKTSEDMTPIPLTDTSFINSCENNRLILQGHFDRVIEKNARLLFYIEYLEIHIYNGDTELYSWGTEKEHPSFMRSSGAAWGSFAVPASLSPSDEVTIILENKYANNYYSAYHDFLESLQTGDSGALARIVFQQNWFYLIAGAVLCLLGIVLLLFALTLVGQSIYIHPSVFFSAFFVIVAGGWLVLDPRFCTLLLGNAPLVMLLECIFQWLFSLMLCAYFSTFMQTKARRVNDILIFTLLSAMGIFLCLQLAGFTDAYAIRTWQTVIVGIGIIICICALRYEIHHGERPEPKALMRPGLTYIIFGVAELLNYGLELVPRGTAISVGLLIFVKSLYTMAIHQIRSSLLMAQRAATLENELNQSRTAIMMSQIQPHFLYNTLLGIQQLCSTNPPKASDALEHFSYYLRQNLHSISSPRLIPFHQEVTHVKNYLYLEKMRFEERLTIRWELNFTDFFLPPMTLQPLAENSVRHGITKKEAGGTLTIRSTQTDASIILTISDDGIGFDPSIPPDTTRPHIGITNVTQRIEALCHGTLQIQSTPTQGTTIQITLPLTPPLS